MNLPHCTSRPVASVMLAVWALLLTAADCSASTRSGPWGSAGQPSSSPTQPARTATGPGNSSYRARPQDAAALASKVPGCAPRPLSAADSGSPGLVHIPRVFTTATTSATCTLRGRKVAIFTFPNPQRQASNEADLQRVDAFYAVGNGWTAAPEEIDEPAGQQSVAQDVAIALHGRIELGEG
jgi:hypothetical protein